MYQYNAIVVRILDGDSVELNIDLGFKIFFKTVARLSHINAPELNSPDALVREAAQASKLFLIGLIPVGSVVVIDSKKLDMYGRPLVVITNDSGINVNDMMLTNNHAVLYK